ncbi:MAG: gephyrin-like molybdotransferase Glp [Verrucomicrobiales bacterium]
MLSLEEALEQILGNVQPLDGELVDLSMSYGRFLREDCFAVSDLPRSDNSAMDGYAVRSLDVAKASAGNPVPLKCIDSIPAGTFSTKIVSEGKCIRLFTGSPMPAGADAVVMQEDTTKSGENIDTILILDAVKPWENVRFQGEDVRKGAVVGRKGDKLTPGRIGLLAASGLGKVVVARRPKVSIVPTGSELIKAGAEASPAAVYESNQATLAALCSGVGAEPVLTSVARDSLQETTATLEEAFRTTDAVITCGGASVGDYDFVKQAFEALGGKLDFWKVSIRPGKPFIFGQLGSKMLFGLPGNPVSAFVTFFLLARPALLKMQGATEISAANCPGILGEQVVNRGDRRHFMRVQSRADGKVVLSGGQGSHFLSSLAEAVGLIDVPANSTIPAGEKVHVIRIDL